MAAARRRWRSAARRARRRPRPAPASASRCSTPACPTRRRSTSSRSATPTSSRRSRRRRPATDANPLAVGHGSMVAGVIRRHAPAAAIVVRRVLDTPLGVADELDVAAALREVRDVHIVNASFGGPAAAPDAMVVFRAAVEDLPGELVVVASAGNEGETRPHYMAGFERVLSVASIHVGRRPLGGRGVQQPRRLDRRLRRRHRRRERQSAQPSRSPAPARRSRLRS